VCGLVGVRGSVVVAFDAGMVFGLEPAATGADHRLLLIELGGRRTANLEDGAFVALDPEALISSLLN
jgi:chemotaxis signal transduction protein